MSKQIVKLVRKSINYLLSEKITSNDETKKIIDFLIESAFYDKDDDFFQKIVKAEGCDTEKYKFFNGKRYTRKEDGHYRGYHGKYLHRDVWEFYNGKIPRGYVIHHKDLNPENNSIENLQLMSQVEHKKLHNKIRQAEIYICEYCGKNLNANIKANQIVFVVMNVVENGIMKIITKLEFAKSVEKNFQLISIVAQNIAQKNV